MFLWDSGRVTGERFCGECGKTKLAQIKIFLGKDRTCRCLDDNARSNDADMTSLLARLTNLHTSKYKHCVLSAIWLSCYHFCCDFKRIIRRLQEEQVDIEAMNLKLSSSCSIG